MLYLVQYKEQFHTLTASGFECNDESFTFKAFGSIVETLPIDRLVAYHKIKGGYRLTYVCKVETSRVKVIKRKKIGDFAEVLVENAVGKRITLIINRSHFSWVKE